MNGKSIGFLIRLIHCQSNKSFNKELEKLELTYSQAEILLFLNRLSLSEVNQIDIEKHLKLRNSTVSGLIRRMGEKGFIKTAPSLRDKRYKRIMLTEKGKQQYDVLTQGAEFAEKTMTSGMSEAEMRTFKDLLCKALENISNTNQEV